MITQYRMDIEGAVAIVTGGARGIGRASAELLLSHGAKVCLTDIDKTLGDKALAELREKFGAGRATFQECDVTNGDQLERVFSTTIKQFGKVDVLLNNAGIVDDVDWERTFQVNAMGVFRGILLAFQHMGKAHGSHGGIVINISSKSGLFPEPLAPAYSSSKYAVVGMTRSFGSPEHFALNGVRVKCICPWIVDTPILDTARSMWFTPEFRVRELGLPYTLIKPQRVAQAVIDLIKDAGKNGCVLEINQDSTQQYVDFKDVPHAAPTDQ